MTTNRPTDFAWCSPSRRSFIGTYLLGLAGTCLGPGWSRANEAAAAPDHAGCGGPEPAARFPLQVQPGQRYLQDDAGRPFLIHGDTAWSLIADLTREDADHYLEDRRARGFNSILASLIEHRFATHAPANAYLEQPFAGQPFEALADMASFIPAELLTPYGTALASWFADVTIPNESYFAHADWIVQRACDKGILVLLAPCYLGYGGGTHGWYRTMIANGHDRLRAYGDFLGRRYRGLGNIVWVHGGDFDPPRKDLVRAVAEGIAHADPKALQTVHCGPETAAMDYWKDERWLGINTIYTYHSVHAEAARQYARSAPMPFFLIESLYENEHAVTVQRLRMQAYQAMLSGAAGHLFGNNPIWHFDGPGLYSTSVTWERALSSPGAESMTHLHRLFTAIPWWRLIPDHQGRLLSGGHGPEDDRAVAAQTDDRRLALIYLPSVRDITIDLAELAGPEVTAEWYDPATGRFSLTEGSPFGGNASRRFRPAARADDAEVQDWVLVLRSSPSLSERPEAAS